MDLSIQIHCFMSVKSVSLQMWFYSLAVSTSALDAEGPWFVPSGATVHGLWPCHPEQAQWLISEAKKGGPG